MRKKVTFEDFLERAKKAHPDEKYFYYEHTYDGITKKVKIKCLEHGDFWQFGTDHVRGQGCPICGIKKSASKRSYTDEEFKELYVKKQGNRYDLSEFKYDRCEKHSYAICKKHGKFRTTASKLLRGEGCPTCFFESVTKDEKGRFLKRN